MRPKVANFVSKITRYAPAKYCEKIGEVMTSPCLNLMGRSMLRLADMLDSADEVTVKGALHGWFLALSNLSAVNPWACAAGNQGWAICPEEDAYITYLSLCIEPGDYSKNPERCVADIRQVGQSFIDNFEIMPAAEYSISTDTIAAAVSYFDLEYDLTRRLWANQRTMIIPLFDIHREALAEPQYRMLGGEIYPHYVIFGKSDESEATASRRSVIYSLAHILANSIVTKAFAEPDGYRVSPVITDKLCWMLGRPITKCEWPSTLTAVLADGMMLNCPTDWRDARIEIDRYQDPQFYDAASEVLYEALEVLDY